MCLDAAGAGGVALEDNLSLAMLSIELNFAYLCAGAAGTDGDLGDVWEGNPSLVLLSTHLSCTSLCTGAAGVGGDLQVTLEDDQVRDGPRGHGGVLRP